VLFLAVKRSYDNTPRKLTRHAPRRHSVRHRGKSLAYLRLACALYNHRLESDTLPRTHYLCPLITSRFSCAHHTGSRPLTRSSLARQPTRPQRPTSSPSSAPVLNQPVLNQPIRKTRPQRPTSKSGMTRRHPHPHPPAPVQPTAARYPEPPIPHPHSGRRWPRAHGSPPSSRWPIPSDQALHSLPSPALIQKYRTTASVLPSPRRPCHPPPGLPIA
jgi:hypothetical protein